ncbi:MAG: alkaline phosphatase PhoX, partial [Stackebrandtia sp.]
MHPPAVASPSDTRWQSIPDSESPYGPLGPPDTNGVCLPSGFSSRVVARSGQPVGGTNWHAAPDGGACFGDGAGWIYVSNSEIPLAGGASAIRFGPDGAVKEAYRILGDTNLNRTGTPTPWGSWLSCEEIMLGRVHETDPFGQHAAEARETMGRFTHSAIACDADREVVYLTEDETDGCFYRFVPEVWGDLSAGRLEVLRVLDGDVEWLPVPSPAPGFLDTATRHQIETARHFDGAADCRYADGVCHFTASGTAWAYVPGRAS